MDNEKLLKERNEKLAKFAGFNETCMGHDIVWMFNNNYPPVNLPDFEKVDECIKWLLPKIEGLDGIWAYPTDDGYYWTVSVIGCPANSFEGDSLAEAIEQYVISEEDEKVELEVV